MMTTHAEQVLFDPRALRCTATLRGCDDRRVQLLVGIEYLLWLADEEDVVRIHHHHDITCTPRTRTRHGNALT